MAGKKGKRGSHNSEEIKIESNAVVEQEAIVPEAEVTEEMKQEEPINTPETAVDVVEEAPERDKEATIRRIKDNALRFGKEYFEKAKTNGCDYSHFGDWQKQYAEMIHRLVNLKDRNVLDIGGAFGALAHAFSKYGTKKVVCTDISKHAIDAKMFPGVEYLVLPIQHMKSIGDAAYDFVHISHVMEHVDVVDHERCVKEIARIMSSKGVCMILGNYKETENLKEYFQKYMECEFVEVSEAQDKPHGFFKNYKWNYLIVVRK